ncbi:nucleoside triphosphate pyrophosphohydrolase [Klebsiella phage Kpn BM7]|nr:nucleoside triphosphate pyrophosphohydrolase [Klebsiella phage Kpn BM7]
MNSTQHALLKLSEECNEVAQICSKIMQFGFDSEYAGKTNRERLTEELNDILGAVLNLTLETDFRFEEDAYATRAKVDKMARYREISKNLGFVQ